VLHPHRDGGHAVDPTASKGPAGAAWALTSADLTDAGTPNPGRRRVRAGEGDIAGTLCPSWDRLADQLPLGAPMTTAAWVRDGRPLVREVVVELGSSAQGARISDRIVSDRDSCQDNVKPQVYAGTNVGQPSKTVTVYWSGRHHGKLFPPHQSPACGGVVIARNGARLGIAVVDWCAGNAQLEKMARAAARALGTEPPHQS